MEITTERRESVEIITVSGRIDSSNAEELDATFKKAFDNRRYNVVVDLSNVEYMSSAGLRALVGALRTSRSRFGDVRLANPSERARTVLELAGMDHLFEIYDSVSAAEIAF